MIKLGILFLLVTFLLAILSRKYFSKYKDRGVFKCIFLSYGNLLYKAIKVILPEYKLEKFIRSTEIIPENRLSNVVEEYMSKALAMGYMLLLLFTSIAFVSEISQKNDNGKEENIVSREGYGKHDSIVEIQLESKTGDKEKYNLKVSSLKLNKEQFDERTKEVFAWLSIEMLGSNRDSKHVSENLNLVNQDKDKMFDIYWKSYDPSCISSTGMLRDCADGTGVRLQARIEYYDFYAVQDYEVTIDTSCVKKNEQFKTAINTLKNLEETTRNNKSIVLPEEVEGISIVLKKDKKSETYIFVILGFIMAFGFVYKKINDLNSRKIMRDNVLIKSYSKLVNHLWLYIGTGMTVRNALYIFAGNKQEKDILQKEITYTLNLIEAGMDEAGAYEELGARLEIPEYNRLFMHISQNLKMGTKDIRRILEDELVQAISINKEYVKKKGEEASTKLIFPMIIMLFVVMIIVMLPAMIGYM